MQASGGMFSAPWEDLKTDKEDHGEEGCLLKRPSRQIMNTGNPPEFLCGPSWNVVMEKGSRPLTPTQTINLKEGFMNTQGW